jgi:hypothetical protein
MRRPRPQRTKDTGPGMTAGNMRRNGVRNLDLYCRRCHHGALLNADHLPDDFDLMRIDRQLVCTRCGAIGEAACSPNWFERSQRPSLTGDQYQRLNPPSVNPADGAARPPAR